MPPNINSNKMQSNNKTLASRFFKFWIMSVVLLILSLLSVLFVALVPPISGLILVALSAAVSRSPATKDKIERLDFMHVTACLTGLIALGYIVAGYSSSIVWTDSLVIFFNGPEMMVVAAALLIESVMQANKLDKLHSRAQKRIIRVVGLVAATLALAIVYHAIEKEMKKERQEHCALEQKETKSPTAAISLPEQACVQVPSELEKPPVFLQPVSRGLVNPIYIAFLWLFAFCYGAYVRLYTERPETD